MNVNNVNIQLYAYLIYVTLKPTLVFRVTWTQKALIHYITDTLLVHVYNTCLLHGAQNLTT